MSGWPTVGVAGEDAVDVDAVQRGGVEPSPVHSRRIGHGTDHHLTGDVVRFQQLGEAGGGVEGNELAAVDTAGEHDPGAGAGAVDEDQGNVHRRGAEVGGQTPAGLLAGLGTQRTDGQVHVLPTSFGRGW